jgi:hypothetical protein
MEIRARAGGFSCGTCIYATPEKVCSNSKVRAPVNPHHGCCNLWSGTGVTFE